MATVQTLIDSHLFQLKIEGDVNRSISKIFCCDLLSIAMSKAPEGCAWVTVMGNKNTLAVASLADAACIILAESVQLNEADEQCAADEGITVFTTDQPVFDAAYQIQELIK